MEGLFASFERRLGSIHANFNGPSPGIGTAIDPHSARGGP